MKKITYSLNYRKPKNQYSNQDELVVCLRYYHSIGNGKYKVTKKVPALNVNLKIGIQIGTNPIIATL